MIITPSVCALPTHYSQYIVPIIIIYHTQHKKISPFFFPIDASNYAIGGVLTQDQGQGHQPIAYTSRKLSDAEQNYAAHEKELLAIMHAIEKWRVYLLGNHFKIWTDHATLKFFQTQHNELNSLEITITKSNTSLARK